MSIESTQPTPIVNLGEYKGNHLWVKREDFIPFSFGGNKARKAQLFFQEFDRNSFDCVVTYGSSSSNHCRVIANECCRRNIECFIVSPEEECGQTFNSAMMELFGAKIITAPVVQVHNTIENLLTKLTKRGKKPFFIEGGGHGNIGTEAYVQCYREIKEQEAKYNVYFDYVFFASGTGTTHAGLVCGKILTGDEKRIIGISIARKNPKGRSIVLESIRSYLGDLFSDELIQASTEFVDDYTTGYGNNDSRVKDTIDSVIRTYGIPLDATYTGKAFMGMTEYLLSKRILSKNILFIHTGGTPLFFDYLRGIE